MRVWLSGCLCSIREWASQEHNTDFLGHVDYQNPFSVTKPSVQSPLKYIDCENFISHPTILRDR